MVGEVAYRPSSFDKLIDEMYELIDKNKYQKALEIFNKLKKNYGGNNTVIIEAEIALDIMEHEYKI